MSLFWKQVHDITCMELHGHILSLVRVAALVGVESTPNMFTL